MKKTYTVSKDKDSGLWYAHIVGLSYVPVFGSFGSKNHAMKCAAEHMGLPLSEYKKLKG